MRTDDLDAVKSKLYEESEPFLAVHQNYNLKLLPSWVAENIEVARVYGNSKKGVILPDGRKYHLDNHINDMTGKEWTFFINSVFSTRYPTSGKEAYAHHIRKIHPTPKPPQLMRDLIQFFTKEGELVFDPFMGVGGTLLGSALCNRISAGIDLNQDYIDAYYKAALDLSLQGFPTECGDCLSILKDRSKMGSLTTGKPISLLLFDPPYSNMMSREKTGADIAVHGKMSTPFSDSDYDLGNMERPMFLCAFHFNVICHHPPYKTCQFSCYRCYGHISLLSMSYKFIVSAPQSRICFIRIRKITSAVLPFCLALNAFDLCPTAPLQIPPDASISSCLK